jgi:hypothetical protein
MRLQVFPKSSKFETVIVDGKIQTMKFTIAAFIDRWYWIIIIEYNVRQSRIFLVSFSMCQVVSACGKSMLFIPQLILKTWAAITAKKARAVDSNPNKYLPKKTAMRLSIIKARSLKSISFILQPLVKKNR